MNRFVSRILLAYGVILLAGGICSILIIGIKSRNLMIASVAAGALSIIIGKLLERKNDLWLIWLARLFPLAAFVLYTQRATLNFLNVIGIVQHDLYGYDAYNKCINVILLIVLSAASLSTWLIVFAFSGRNNSTQNTNT